MSLLANICLVRWVFDVFDPEGVTLALSLRTNPFYLMATRFHVSSVWSRIAPFLLQEATLVFKNPCKFDYAVRGVALKAAARHCSIDDLVTAPGKR